MTSSIPPRIQDFSQLQFDPERGTLVRAAPGSGYGYWAGGSRVWFDPETAKFVLFYRKRLPLEHGRGTQCYLAESSDGIRFTDVWRASKDELCANSIEVGQPVRDPSGEWRLYLSYEYKYGSHWRIDVLRGASPSSLDTQGRRTVISPDDFGLSFIKDPFVVVDPGGYRLYACGTPRQRFVHHRERVGTAGREATLLFESSDGLYFEHGRYVFEPASSGWDSFTARLGCLFRFRDGYAGFYDGARGVFDMYEEGTGLAVSKDGQAFSRASRDRPWVRGSHGNVRYCHALRLGSRLYVYYELTREDLSHELRVIQLPIAD